MASRVGEPMPPTLLPRFGDREPGGHYSGGHVTGWNSLPSGSANVVQWTAREPRSWVYGPMRSAFDGVREQGGMAPGVEPGCVPGGGEPGNAVSRVEFDREDPVTAEES